MRTSALSRLAALTVGLAVAGTMLAAPASADAGLDLTGTIWQYESEATLMRTANRVCTGSDVSRAQVFDDVRAFRGTGESEALLISTSIDMDGAPTNGGSALDVTCTFALIGTNLNGPFMASLEGTYSLTVGSATDVDDTVTGGLGSWENHTEPIFTDVDEYATAALVANGSRTTAERGTVTVTSPSRARNAGEIQRAKRLYEVRVKEAKTTLKKANKKAAKIKNKAKKTRAKKKAKKTYKTQVSGAKRIYNEMLAPSKPISMKTPGWVPVSKPFSIAGVL